jgi:hypothetical protein
MPPTLEPGFGVNVRVGATVPVTVSALPNTLI